MNFDLASVVTVSAIVGAFSGVVGSISQKVIGNFIDSYFYNKNKKSEDKSALADKIIEICIRSLDVKSEPNSEELTSLVIHLVAINRSLVLRINRYHSLRLDLFKILNPKPEFAETTRGTVVPTPVDRKVIKTKKEELEEEFKSIATELLVEAIRMKGYRVN